MGSIRIGKYTQFFYGSYGVRNRMFRKRVSFLSLVKGDFGWLIWDLPLILSEDFVGICLAFLPRKFGEDDRGSAAN